MDFYPDGGSVQSGCWYGRDAKPGGKRQDTSWYHRRYFIPFHQDCAATVGPCATTTGASDSPAPSPPRGAPVRRPATRTKAAGKARPLAEAKAAEEARPAAGANTAEEAPLPAEAEAAGAARPEAAVAGAEGPSVTKGAEGSAGAEDP